MKNKKAYISDFIFSIAGLLAMNGVVSLVVYPTIEKTSGAAFQGQVLFFMSIAALLGASLGNGANYGRLKIYTEEKNTVNGEYNIFLVFSGLLIVAFTFVSILIKGNSAEGTWIGIFGIFLSTAVRYYADVEYRLSLNYKRFALYYVIIAAGYLLGLLIYRFTGAWPLIFITGEIAGILFVVLTGKVFRGKFFERTARFPQHMKTVSVLAGSYFLSDFVSSADRLLLPVLVTGGDELSSVFYYASLVGKLMSLLSAPLNGVLSGHIAKKEGGLKRKQFAGILLWMLGIWAVVTALSVLGSFLFVKLFYPEHLEEASPLFLLANAGQVIFFICNTLMVVVLRYTNERNLLFVSIAYIAVFFAVTVPLVLSFGIWGLAWGIFAVNVLKFILFAVFGFFGLKKDAAAKEKEA